MRVEAIPAAGAEAMAFKALVHLARGQIKANWAHQGLDVYLGRERHVATVRRSIRSAWPHGRAQRGCILCMVAGRKSGDEAQPCKPTDSHLKNPGSRRSLCVCNAQ